VPACRSSSEVTQEFIQGFAGRYARPLTGPEISVREEVFGDAEGVFGYTTREQADGLARQLALRPPMKLLDIGSGRGWPGLHLARVSGCFVCMTDIPDSGLRAAARIAERDGILERTHLVQAGGADLPFRDRAFDCVVHTDVL